MTRTKQEVHKRYCIGPSRERNFASHGSGAWPYEPAPLPTTLHYDPPFDIAEGDLEGGTINLLLACGAVAPELLGGRCR